MATKSGLPHVQSSGGYSRKHLTAKAGWESEENDRDMIRFVRLLLLPPSPTQELFALGARPQSLKWAIVQYVKALTTGKLRFIWRPAQSEVLVYSRDSEPHIKTLLGDITYGVIDNKFKTNFAGTICLQALLRASFDHTLQDVPLYGRYVAHFVELSRCKLVVSAIEAQSALCYAGLLRPGLRRLAIQTTMAAIPFAPAKNCKSHLADTFVLWSDAHRLEISDLISEKCPSLAPKPEMVTLGSVKSNQVEINSRASERGLVFISQWRPYINDEFYDQERELLPFLARWCNERAINLYVLGRYLKDPGAERDYFAELTRNRNLNLIGRSKDWKTSFRILDQFDLVVTVDSSLGLEALGRGKKTLFYTDWGGAQYKRCPSPVMRNSRSGPCWVSDGNIGRFEKLLNKVWVMPGPTFDSLCFAENGLVPPYDQESLQIKALLRREIARAS